MAMPISSVHRPTPSPYPMSDVTPTWNRINVHELGGTDRLQRAEALEVEHESVERLAEIESPTMKLIAVISRILMPSPAWYL